MKSNAGMASVTINQLNFIIVKKTTTETIATIAPGTSFRQEIRSPSNNPKGKEAKPIHSLNVSFEGSSPSPNVKSNISSMLSTLQNLAIVLIADSKVTVLFIL